MCVFHLCAAWRLAGPKAYGVDTQPSASHSHAQGIAADSDGSSWLEWGALWLLLQRPASPVDSKASAVPKHS
jgi:hypothetical protein